MYPNSWMWLGKHRNWGGNPRNEAWGCGLIQNRMYILGLLYYYPYLTPLLTDLCIPSSILFIHFFIYFSLATGGGR